MNYSDLQKYVCEYKPNNIGTIACTLSIYLIPMLCYIGEWGSLEPTRMTVEAVDSISYFTLTPIRPYTPIPLYPYSPIPYPL